MALTLGAIPNPDPTPNTDYPLVTVTNPSDDNQLALELLYQKIAVLETVENLKNGALIWNRVAPYQFQSKSVIGSDTYDLYVTKLISNGTVTFDVRKNANPYYFINSIMEPSLTTLFDDLSTTVGGTLNEAANKDKDLLQDLQSQANVH